jgi:phosphoribosylglycinamide formyltransferase-1
VSSCIRRARNEAHLSERHANLVTDLVAPDFAQPEVHRALEALDRAGIVPLREHRTPERILAWIDAEFGGTASIDAASGGIWIAQDRHGPLAFAAYDSREPRYHWLRGWSQNPGVGSFGPFGVCERARGTGLGKTLLHAALFSLRERGYRQALFPAVSTELVPYFERAAGARVVERIDLGRGGRRWRATVLASGSGGNFQAVLDGARAGDLPLEIAALIANRPGAFALERAAAVNVPATVVAWNRQDESRAAYDLRVLDAVARTQPDVVLLLGWMHVLPASFVARFPEALNLHPAFLPLDPALDAVTMPDGVSLPAYRGAHAFDDALAAGQSWAGATVHRVGAAVDRGEVYARAPLRVAAPVERSALDMRLHSLERDVVATAIRHWAYRQP